MIIWNDRIYFGGLPVPESDTMRGVIGNGACIFLNSVRHPLIPAIFPVLGLRGSQFVSYRLPRYKNTRAHGFENRSRC